MVLVKFVLLVVFIGRCTSMQGTQSAASPLRKMSRLESLGTIERRQNLHGVPRPFAPNQLWHGIKNVFHPYWSRGTDEHMKELDQTINEYTTFMLHDRGHLKSGKNVKKHHFELDELKEVVKVALFLKRLYEKMLALESHGHLMDAEKAVEKTSYALNDAQDALKDAEKELRNLSDTKKREIRDQVMRENGFIDKNQLTGAIRKQIAQKVDVAIAHKLKECEEKRGKVNLAELAKQSANDEYDRIYKPLQKARALAKSDRQLLFKVKQKRRTLMAVLSQLKAVKSLDYLNTLDKVREEAEEEYAWLGLNAADWLTNENAKVDAVLEWEASECKRIF